MLNPTNNIHCVACVISFLSTAEISNTSNKHSHIVTNDGLARVPASRHHFPQTQFPAGQSSGVSGEIPPSTRARCSRRLYIRPRYRNPPGPPAAAARARGGRARTLPARASVVCRLLLVPHDLLRDLRDRGLVTVTRDPSDLHHRPSSSSRGE